MKAVFDITMNSIVTGIFMLLTLAPGAYAELHSVHGEFIHLGNVGPETLFRDVQLVNTGSRQIDVDQIKSSCSCTLAPIDKEHIQPGDTATLRVSIDLRNKTGELEQHVTVTTLGGDSVRVHFGVNVVRALVVEPLSFPSLFGIPVGSEVTTAVTIFNDHTEPITLFKPRATHDNVNIAFNIEDELIVPAGEAVDIVVYLLPIEVGISTGMITIQTSSEINPELTVMLTFGASAREGVLSESPGINNTSTGGK